MKNLKKLLAVIVSICVLATFTVPAFAAETTKTDAKICEELGVLRGEDISVGVTPEYLAKGTNRLQAAILYLRLIGKEDEALAFTGTETFEDAGQVGWTGGKAILAYLKAHPELGWVGDGKKFDPNGAASAQMMYKVALEALGYKQGTDFQYADTITFAASLGLTKVAAIAELTNDNTATALIEILKGTVKGGTTTLVEKLAATNPTLKAAAEANGLINPYVALDVKSVTAVTYMMVDIALNTAATKVDASKISIKDAAGTELAVTDVTLSADGKTVTVDTAAQVAGTVYKMTVDSTVYEFVGLVKDVTKPALSSAIALTNTSVKITFDNSDLDPVTATDAANYTIADLTVTAASVSGANVTLTTSSQTSGKLYEVKVTKVADKTGNVMADASKKFGGKAPDTVKPVIASVTSKDGVELTVTYTEAEKLSDSALDIANYTINNDVTVTAAKFKKDTNVLGGTPVVILTTSAQVSGKLYKLTVKNVADVAGNKIADVDKSFGGTAVDTVKIGIESVVADTNTAVIVTLNDTVDATTVVPANFTIDGDLTVTAAAVDADNEKVVNLTTSAQTAGKLYTLTIANLKDEAGNGVNTDLDDKKFGGKAADTTKPTISKVEALTNTSIKVTFSEKVEKASATTLSNYVFDGGLAYPTKATLSDDKTYVTLNTLPQSAKVYSLKISNVKDLSGNVITADSEKKFAGMGDALTALKVEGAVAIDKYTVKVLFNQAVDATNSKVLSNYTFTGGAGLNGKLADNAYLTDDNKSVVLTFNTAGDAMATTEIYKVAVAGVTSEYGVALDTDTDEAEFAGISDDKADITVEIVNVIDEKNIEVVFSADIAGTPLASAFALYKNEGDIPADTNTGANLVGNAASLSGKKVRVTFTTAMEDNTVYYLNMISTHALNDKSGLYPGKVKFNAAADKSEGIFATGDLSAVTLKVDAAVMTNDNTLEIYFNNDIAATTGAGVGQLDPNTDIKVKNASGDVVTASEFKSVYKISGKKLTVYFVDAATTMTNGYVYKVEVLDPTAIKYKYDNAVTLSTDYDEMEFAAVDTDNEAPYMVTASAVADNKVKVTLSEDIAAAGTIDAADIKIKNTKTGKIIGTADYSLAYTAGKDFFIVTLASGKFVAGTTYEIAVVNGSDITDFAGIGAIKKATADAANYDNSVTFTGVGTTAAIVAGQVTLIYGDAAAADSIAFSATAGLVANAPYTIKLTNSAAEFSVTAGVGGAIGTTLTGTVAGVAGAETMTIYDAAGNEVCKDLALTAL
ncbi:MAG: hypothetical protein ABFD25_19315 [Clostridiaceae bacterium]